MKASLVAAAAALAGSASASRRHAHAQAHELFHARGHNDSEVCSPGCTTIWTTITGSATWKPTPAPSPPSTSAPVVPVPTPAVTTCPTPGTYTFPASTVVVTETTTVCAASTTSCGTGTHTLGGVTTTVSTSTVVTCPYATISTKSGGAVTTVLTSTVYTCPSAGVYTVAPITTVVATPTVVVIPVVETYCPGTYTAPPTVTTVTETDVVVVCPFTSVGLSSTPAPAAPTTTAAVAPSSSPAAPATTSPATSPAAPVGGSGGKWSITYTPYTDSGDCKDAGAVLKDITAIKAIGFSAVRIYSTDCGALQTVGAACETVGLKIIIGIFINQPGCSNSNPDVDAQIKAIQDWAKWDLVEMCVVGNESGFNKYCSADQLKTLISSVKTMLTSNGCNAPVTTTDVVSVWQDETWASTLCPVIDVVGANCHAYYNAQTTSDQAGPFVRSQMDLVKSMCNKPVYVLESGWPSAGPANGVATCSTSDQAAAIKSISETCGDSVALFTYTTDLWKHDETEASYGLSSLFASGFSL